MKRTLIIILVIVIALPIAYYLISPVFRVVEVQEESPLELSKTLEVKDAMDSMDAATRADFEKQVDEMRDKITVVEDDMPKVPRIAAQGSFNARAHDVAGKALLIEADGEKIIRFEGFETINGPDLRIYLSSDLGNDDFIDLGKIKATRGNINYELPPDADTKKYKYVLVWCRAFSVLFSYAELS